MLICKLKKTLTALLIKINNENHSYQLFHLQTLHKQHF